MSFGLEAVEFSWKEDGGNVLAFPQNQEFVGVRVGWGEVNLPKWERRS